MEMRRLMVVLLVLNGGFYLIAQSAPSGAATERSRTIRDREQWFARGRTTRDEPAAATRYRALRHNLDLQALRNSQTPVPNSPGINTSGDWVPLGPASLTSDASGSGLQDYNYVAGRVTSVAIDGADISGNTVYVGGAFGGIWKSVNAGPLSSNPASIGWTPLTDNQPTLAIGAIAIQPQAGNPNPAQSVILAGTGETNGSTDSYYGLGILRSADAGATWKLIPSAGAHSFAGLGFSKIAFSTNTPATVVAAAGATSQGITDGAENPVSVNRGIYFSINSGISWSYSTVMDNAAINPSSATDVVYNGTAGLFFAAVSLHGIYSSVDGAAWTRIPNQPGAISIASCPTQSVNPSVCAMYRAELAVVPGRNEMYVWYVDANDNDGGIWTSSNGGTSWSQINDSGIASCGDLFGGCGTEQGTYNLTLAAVPNGSATDLYAGAVNLYKCTISLTSSNCGGSGAFINLTHVYGCSSIARVHPAQHAIASILIDGGEQDLLYFANDGGLYRALDGYTGLFTGTCGENNQFDSLNETLGSLTQVVAFSQSESATPNADVLLAGAQANGSPGTVSAEGSTSWQNVNAGDGGYTAIGPGDDNLWFVSNPPDSVSGVNIFSCDLGINCHTQDFQVNEIVSSATLGGDAGAFNTPFILDPQNPAQMIVGTCRVWRGPTGGGTFSPLSDDFETGGDGICNGNETNVVRALAAGGIQSGVSNVIYAGTDGAGPLSTGLPIGGRVWVSSNVVAGPATWTDQTGSINPEHFPISSIVVDTSDSTALTAYAGIMGFAASHVWKTASGGTSWVDFTGSGSSALPAAPVNALVIDQTASVIYAGTDVGVFASSTVSPAWSEVRPAPGSNNPGFLPNVAVTALHIFDPHGVRRLRASTYGRGLWEISGFNLSRPVPASISVGEPATSTAVTMQLTSTMSNIPVILSCANLPAGAACNFANGNSQNAPAMLSMTVSTTASTPCGTFLVAISAVSPPYPPQTQNLPVTVAGGFCFSILNTSGLQTVAAGSSASYILSVSPSSGKFPNAVSLAVSGCPPAAVCSFSSSQIPAGNGSTNVTLTVATTAGTGASTYAMTVTGTSTSAPIAKVNIPLIVQSGGNANFSITNTSGAQTINSGQTASYALNVTPSSGIFSNAVTFACSQLPATASCAFNPTQVTAGSGPTLVTLAVATSSSTPGGAYSIQITGTSGLQTASISVSLTVQTIGGAFSFTMSNSGPATITIGSSGQYAVTVTPSFGTFPNPVTLTSTACSSVITCSLSSTQVNAGNAATTVYLNVATQLPAVSSAGRRSRIFCYGLALPMLGFVLVCSGPSMRRSLQMLFVILSLVLCSGCGGLQGGSAAPAPNPGTPVGVYSVTVIGTAGSLTANTTISFTVQSAP